MVLTLKEASREYSDKAPIDKRSPILELEAMNDALNKQMRAWRSKDFDKPLMIADPTNGVDFLNELTICIFEI